MANVMERGGLSSSKLRAPARVGAAALTLSLAFASTARASEQTRFQPTAIISAGVDDNLLFNGTGGDRVGRAGFRIDLKTWDHLWTLSLNLGASVYGFQLHQKIVPLGESTLHSSVTFGHWDALHLQGRVRGSDDPLGLAQIGLLGAEGSVIGYRAMGEEEHAFDARWSLATLVRADGIAYLDQPYQQKTGEAAGIGLQPRYMLTRDLMLNVEANERAFFAQGISGTAFDSLAGARLRLARRLFADVQAGPSFFHDSQGVLPLPVARTDLEYDDRNWGAGFTAWQDLAVPNGRAGVLLMQLAEATARYGDLGWEFRVRGGYYRALSSPRSNEWTPGYGVQLEAYRHVGSFAWVGVTALRFERLPTALESDMARDAIYAQIEVTEGRP
jgi:hypothetical protein